MYNVNFSTSTGKAILIATYNSKNDAIAEAQESIFMNSGSPPLPVSGRKTVIDASGAVIFDSSADD